VSLTESKKRDFVTLVSLLSLVSERGVRGLRVCNSFLRGVANNKITDIQSESGVHANFWWRGKIAHRRAGKFPGFRIA